MSTLVECVPNFSEGRDAAKVEALVEALCSVPGVALLDREMDADHNRCVITIVGPKEAIAEAAVRGVGRAAELIDLTRHQGAHPRLGAADVVPFVPIEGVTLEDCVEMARAVGEQIWKRFGIPVFLYEAAATRPERVNLENIRRGQFEGLREEIAANPERRPDFGEARVHPTAGATVVGARKFLIAYNINLDTPDVNVAKQVAKAVRFSSGGLRYAKAMAVDLKARGLAQVSMNLTDFEQTPIFRAFEMVRREAGRYGASIAGSEIVGLVPKQALEEAAGFYLQLENFDPQHQILENRLASVLAEKKKTQGLAALAGPLLEAVAAPTPTPGGGSCAALAGALAAGLGEMVAKLSATKKSLAPHAERLARAAEELGRLREKLQSAIERDAASFEAVLAASRLPKSSEEEENLRQQALESATRQATEVPLEVGEAATAVLEILQQLGPITSAGMASDLNTGLHLAGAAIRGALENVKINLEGMSEGEFLRRARARAEKLEARLGETASVSR